MFRKFCLKGLGVFSALMCCYVWLAFNPFGSHGLFLLGARVLICLVLHFQPWAGLQSYSGWTRHSSQTL